ncbi:MAG TPA: hypothetical protein VEU75_03755, partial [Candidatus Acidoferrum sp.]|nr:hypothetical protein [Candidatus Acidoferrum sp.]
ASQFCNPERVTILATLWGAGTLWLCGIGTGFLNLAATKVGWSVVHSVYERALAWIVIGKENAR